MSVACHRLFSVQCGRSSRQNISHSAARMARNVSAGAISGRRIQLPTNNCKGPFHKVTTDILTKRQAT